jgi:hypothetical protein
MQETKKTNEDDTQPPIDFNKHIAFAEIVLPESYATGRYSYNRSRIYERLRHEFMGFGPRICVVAPPGSGKSTWIRKILRNRSISFIDLEWVRDPDGAPDPIQDVSFRLGSLAQNGEIRVVTHINSSQFQIYLRRLNIETVLVKLSDEDWHSRLDGDDNRGRDEWRKRVGDDIFYGKLDEYRPNQFDVTLSDFSHELFEYAVAGIGLPSLELSGLDNWVSERNGTKLARYDGQSNYDPDLAILTVAQILTLLEYDVTGNRTGPHLSVARHPEIMNMVTYVPKASLPYWRYPTSHSNVTFHTKTFWAVFSRSLGLTDASTRDFRQHAIIARGGVSLNHPKVNGAIMSNGRIMPLQVSGHAIYLIIASLFFPVDVSAWSDHVAWNVERALTKKKDDVDRLLLKTGAFHENIAESTFRDLWHNYHEWIIGIDVAVSVLHFFDLPAADPLMLSFLRARFDRLLAEHPNFGLVWSRDTKKMMSDDPQILSALRVKFHRPG